MAKSSGGTRGASGGARAAYSGMSASEVLAKYPELATKVKDETVRSELVEAIQAYEKEFGITPDSLEFYNRKDNVAGRQELFGGTRLNLKYLGDHAQSMQFYSAGDHPKGTEIHPAKATLIHELTHALENKHGYYGSKMSKEIDAAYDKFISGWRQGSKNNPVAHSMGSYSTRRTEFFQESVSAYMLGIKNQYTTTAYKIAKKYSK